MFITGVVDTGDKLFSGVNDTGEKLIFDADIQWSPVIPVNNLSPVTTGDNFIAGDNNTGDNFIAGGNDTGDKFIAGDKNKDAMEVGSCQSWRV